MTNKPKRRWFQFSLMSLLVALSIFSVSFAWIGRERRHEQAKDDLWRLGGHTSMSAEGGTLVYFWRHEEGVTYKHVIDLEAAVRLLRQMKDISLIVLLQNQSDWKPVLEREFPGVEIRMGHGGVI